MKRFIYACLAKRFGETFDDAIVVDECTVELKMYNPTNWRKEASAGWTRAVAIFDERLNA
jgi:hypothetical protein